jgi:LEA14-like dessication related protein
MYRKISVFFLGCVAMSILSCASLRQELIRKPAVSFEQMELHDMSLFEATAVFKFNVINPNPMGLSIRNIAYHLNISDKKFIKGISDKDLRVRAAGLGKLELPITISYADLSESSENISDKVEYDIFGSVEIGPFTIPYRARGTLNLPKPPRLSLKSIRVTETSHTYAGVIFEFELENDNLFAVAVRRMEYNIYIAGKEFASGSGENISIPLRTKLRLEMPMKINFFKNGQSLAAILDESSGVYEISGTMAFDDIKEEKRKIPFRRAGSVPIVKTDHP